MNKSGLTFIQYDRCKVWAKTVEKDKVPVQIMTSFCQWTLVWSVQMQSLGSLSSALVSYISVQTTDICQPAPVWFYLSDRKGKKKALTSPISSFFHSPSHQTDCQSLIDSCRFLPLTPIFRCTCWYPVTEADQTKKKKMSRWHYIINTQKLLFIKSQIWSEQNIICRDFSRKLLLVQMSWESDKPGSAATLEGLT